MEMDMEDMEMEDIDIVDMDIVDIGMVDMNIEHCGHGRGWRTAENSCTISHLRTDLILQCGFLTGPAQKVLSVSW